MSNPIRHTERGCKKTPQGRRRPLRARAWWVMRELARFDLEELLRTVADGTERAAAANLRRYIAALEQHQVLARLPGAKGKPKGQWRLRTDLGPLPPVPRPQRGLFDHNTKTLMALPEEQAA